ncbi:MAG: chromosomal replication initiator protein DnaA [Akkermansiaceae bacterium]|nr:chromosomal replication initiator protein DnaA [Akkermansiaceae bacterium]
MSKDDGGKVAGGSKISHAGKAVAEKKVAKGKPEWSAVAARLQQMVSEDAYQRWFRQARLKIEDENHCTVMVPSETHVLWIEANYMPELTRAISEETGCCGRPNVKKANGGWKDTGKKPTGGSKMNLLNQPGKVTGPGDLQKRLKSVGLNPLYTFDRFVVGGNNQFAHAACKAVASGARTAYNPLFMHGGSGLGKTHLMQGIGQEILRSRPDAKVVYLTCERFTNEFIDAVRKGELEKFRRKYRRADVMLIDDIQFLTGKEKSQEEFFHTFNALLDGQAQIVLSSDRPASEIQSLEPRLVSRFECGLTVPLQPPQMETRVAILRRKMEEWEVKVQDHWVRFIAERIRSNVRRLEGALVRLATYTSLGQGDLTNERIEELLRDILREEAAAKVTVDAIQKLVAEYFDIRLADMTSRRRPANIAFPRQIAMYLSRKLTGGSLVEIGEAFGGRDHGTVIHACKKVEQMMSTDDQIRQTVAALGARLNR